MAERNGLRQRYAGYGNEQANSARRECGYLFPPPYGNDNERFCFRALIRHRWCMALAVPLTHSPPAVLSKARKRASLVALMNTRPPAVTAASEIRCRWAAALATSLSYHAQYTASGARPLRSIVARCSHGGAWQGSWSQNRSPRPSERARYGIIEPPPASCGRSLKSIELTYSLRPDRMPVRLVGAAAGAGKRTVFPPA